MLLASTQEAVDMEMYRLGWDRLRPRHGPTKETRWALWDSSALAGGGVWADARACCDLCQPSTANAEISRFDGLDLSADDLRSQSGVKEFRARGLTAA